MDEEILKRVRVGRRMAGGIQPVVKNEYSLQKWLCIRLLLYVYSLLYGTENWIYQKKHENRMQWE